MKAAFWLITLTFAWIGAAAPLGLASDVDARDPGEQDSGEGLVNKLLAPGPLMEGHKDLEHSACLKCHDAGKGVPDQKCLTCHTDIAKSIAKGKSFHGMTKAPCFGCHSDHQGRAYNSTAVNKASFDHSKTGFLLHGAHAKLACVKCHTEKRTSKPTRQSDTRFFGKTTTCNSCHSKQDIHFFPPKWAAKECGACHSESTWKGATFDHKKDTGYALVGDHAKIKCASCHVPKGKDSAKYNFPELSAKQCLSCHSDFHKGRLDGKFKGGNCERCHNQDSWKIQTFDHKITGFVLAGAHTKAACVDCHKQDKTHATALKNLDFTGLRSDCASCHKDYHGFRAEKSPKLGALSECKTCHNEGSWKSGLSFNHNKDTDYPIDGKHVGVKCFACHTPRSGSQKTPDAARTYHFPELAAKTCETCHKSPHGPDSAPAFRQGKCTTCHTTQGWKILNMAGGGFNHSTMTRFPLTGDHLQVSCKGCHLKNGQEVYKFPGQDKQFCESCHANVHKEQFSAQLAASPCLTCHNTTTFKAIKFNHKSARFQLNGAHATIASDCSKCHKPTGKMLASKPPRAADKFMFEHAATGFCVDCHANVHKNQFSPAVVAKSDNCLQCHNDRKFSDLSAFDHNKTRFKIAGAHINIKDSCSKCHYKTKSFLSVQPPRHSGKFDFGEASGANGGFCLACHKSVHIGQFKEEFAQKPCLTCHTQQTFEARRPFDHNQTDFKIVGAHTAIADNCSRCHIKTAHMLPTKPPKPASLFLYKHAETGYCEACHAQEHVQQFHPNFANAPCVNCHNQDGFAKNIKFDHHKARYELKFKHLEVKCGECHTPGEGKFRQPPHHVKDKFWFEGLFSKDCALCHKDPHDGRFGGKCSTCHTERSWDATTNFHKDFVLTGAHYQLECGQCHVNNRQLTGMGHDCKMCHQKDDVHMGAQPDCQSCHTQQFWSATHFQHGLTNFPLRGAHRLLECNECHAQGVYQGKSSDCVSCHLEDSLQVAFPNHKVAGFQQCGDCHNQFQFRKK